MTDLSELAAHYPSMKRAQGEIETIATSLTSEHRKLDRDMAEFLDRDWTGAAADSFRTHFHEWTEGAASLLEGLNHMGALIGGTMQLIQDKDGDITSDVDRLVQRLGLI